jgi:outer membrane cobalamin receptor
MITYVFPTVLNVARARIKGLELAAEATYWGVRWRASFTAQRPRDDTTGAQLQGRGERFGTVAGTWTRGDWTLAGTVHATDERFDSTDENPASRLGGYATLDARVRYRIDKQWSAELSAMNLTDKRYESAVGYEGARRSVLLALRFEAF